MSHPAIAAVLLLTAAAPNASFADYPALTEAFRAALFGETEAIDARDRKTQMQLARLGVKVKETDDSPIDLSYRFPSPMVISGATVSRVVYTGDSGSLFYAVAQGDVDAFVKRFQLRRVPAGMKETHGIYSQYYKWLGKRGDTFPYPGIFYVKIIDRKKGLFEFGTQTFDG